jgi:hypothetical protein
LSIRLSFKRRKINFSFTERRRRRSKQKKGHGNLSAAMDEESTPKEREAPAFVVMVRASISKTQEGIDRLQDDVTRTHNDMILLGSCPSFPTFFLSFLSSVC